MPFTIDTNMQDALDDLWRLRQANKAALREIAVADGTAAGNMVTGMTSAFAEEWERDAPRLTGTLASATRETFAQGVGMVFIDPAVVNPVFGGKPAEYGAVVHQRKPWVSRLFTRSGLSRVTHAARVFVEAIGELYEK